MSSFGFVQFELAGALGLDDGRYPVRPAGDPSTTDAVLVARTFAAPPPARRRLRRPRPKDADPGRESQPAPITELTVIDSEPLAEDGQVWLEGLRLDAKARDELVERALSSAVRAVAARRVVSADPSVPDPTLGSALAVRIGHGGGDALVDGHWAGALELPVEIPRRSRAAALRPQERFAAILGGHETPLACEELLLRARSDLDAGRGREAALQLRVGLEAMLAERDGLRAPGQDEDLGALDGRRQATGEAANAALRGNLSPDRLAEVAETVAICERVLRRRAAHR